ncbi:MAG: hypothetical protein LBQ02_02680 [Candidatus Nomurabacteria bacterium]|jgi:hypothetical protein|nr:hypothetical protein [Candidatus Nomurabacteria bacterium]
MKIDSIKRLATLKRSVGNWAIVSVLLAMGLTGAAFAAPDPHVQRYQIIINGNPAIPPNAHIQRYNIVIQSPIYLTLSSSDINLAVMPNVETSDYTQVTVDTTATNGYKLTMSVSTSDSDLICGTDNSYTIPSIASAGNLNSNTWGFSHATNTAIPSTWQPIPASSPITLTNKTAPTITGGDTTYLHFGVKADYSQQPCDYTSQITLTGEVN